jgi:Spy/CpxP family protein refolding chaperone
MKRSVLMVAALLLVAAMAEAQRMPPGKWWRRAEVVRELALTTEQQDRLDDVFTAAADELIDAKADVEKLQVALRSEIDRPQLRRAEIQRVVANLNAARGKLFERELMMLVDMRGVLNDTQWNRLRQFLDRMDAQGPLNRQRAPQMDPPMRRPGAGRRQP